MVRYEKGKVSIDFMIVKLKERQEEDGNGNITQNYFILDGEPVKYRVAIAYLKALKREGYKFVQ
jgi:hypothetical protein